MKIKDGIFSVGIDDSPHFWGKKKSELIFLFFQGTELENILHESIDLDGFNATDVIIDVLKPRTNKFRIIVTHGITVGGFNPIDINKVSDVLGIPVIAVTENLPRGDFFKAIENLADYPKRKQILESAGELTPFETLKGNKKIYYQKAGIDNQSVESFLKKFAIKSRLPKQVQMAHRIATGLSTKAIDRNALDKINNINNDNKPMEDTLNNQKKKVKQFILNNKELQNFPEQLKNHLDIEILDLSKNKLKEIPEWIIKLTLLKELNLSYNNFTVFPNEILKCLKLENLIISSNNMDSLSNSIGSLKSLRFLNAENNNFSELPNSLGDIKSLELLNLYNNNLKKLPDSIGKLKNLRVLRLDTNNLVEIPGQIGDLKELRELNLWKNNLSSLPTSIENLSNLRELNLFKNNFSRIPYHIWKIDGLVPKMEYNPLLPEDKNILYSDYEEFREYCRKRSQNQSLKN